MSDYTMSETCRAPNADVLAHVRAALAGAGFGIITEIDLQATLAAKLGVEVPAQVILGACNPTFAHRAITIEPSVAALLPCNVVVRSVDGETTRVEAFDPAAMAKIAGESDELEAVVGDVRHQLRLALDTVAEALA